MKYFGVKLVPGAGCADHGHGIRAGFKQVFPRVPLAGCWPHVAWSLSHGKSLPKTHKRFEEICKDFEELHTAHTEKMYVRLVKAIGAEWGDDDDDLNTLWESMVLENANWYLGFCSVPSSTPSQQAQESWHNWGIMMRLRGMLRGSTKTVLTTTLPHVLQMDALLMPDDLNFTLPVQWIPPQTYARAAALVQGGEDTVQRSLGNYYVLSQSNTVYKKLTKALIAKCAAAPARN